MIRNRWLAGIVALSVIAMAGRALASPPDKKHRPEASIAFANHGGVEDWQAEGDSTIYFRDQFRHWYKATLMMPAFDLPFVETIGIDSGPTGSLDKWGGVIIHHRRYPFASFEAVAGPPGKTKAGTHTKPAAKGTSGN